MNTQITKVSYPTLSKPSVSEILRYLHTNAEDAQSLALIDECIGEISGKLTPRAVYREYDIGKKRDGSLELGFCSVISKDLAKALDGCGSIVLFAATLGSEADRLLLRYTKTSPARALVLDAVLSERIEALCDMLETEITMGKGSRPRFSAGYGDLPIELQKDIFCALDCEKHIGLTLTESLLMSPTKSVTAIIGITDKVEK